MLDDDDGIAPLHQTVQQLHDLFYIGGVQTGGGLIQHVNVALLVEVFGQLHPLTLTAGEGGKGLPEGEIGQTHLQHGAQRLAELSIFPEKIVSVRCGHIQNFHDAFSLVPVGQGFAAVSLPLAGFADRGHRIHEHKLCDDPSSAAADRAAAFAVEGKEGCIHAVFRCHHLANLVKEAQEGGRGGAAGSGHRGLIHQHHLVCILPGEHVPDERAFAGSCHAGDHGQHVQRDIHRHVFQIVDTGVPHRKKGFRRPGLVFQGDYLLHGLAGFGAGEQQRFVTALKQNLTAVFPRKRPDIDDLVGNGDHIPVVLHHQHRVALVPQALQKPGHAVHIPGVHSGAGFIKDVGHAGQAASHVAHQLEPLCFAAGQCGGLPVHGEVR